MGRFGVEVVAGAVEVGGQQVEDRIGDRGDGQGENTQWIDPKPRDFTQAVFKCRSTPSGTLPTDQDIINTIRRGMVNSNMPQWRPLPDQMIADLFGTTDSLERNVDIEYERNGERYQFLRWG